MKLAFIAASIAATANIQALELGATCQTGTRPDGTDAVENLVIKIPYPDERTAKLLSLEAGDCDVNNYGGSMTWAAGVATLLIPIDACAMRGELYGTPVVARSYGLYRPTATVTFGHKMGDVDVVFRTLPIAAECGKKTSYTVEFNYNNVTSADTEGCTIVDGVCVFPAYGDDAKFEIKEYTDDNFNVEVNENTRARIAGNPIHLSMRVTGLAVEAKFAVTNCKIVDGDKELVLLNPGAESNPSCELNEIGLSAKYELSNGDFVFNFQHILFLLRKTQQESTSTFSLQCSVEICEKTDASSKCNQAAAVCSGSAVEKKSYMCSGLCGNSDECSVDVSDDTVSCKACTCDHGTGALGSTCLDVNTEQCLEGFCDDGYYSLGNACAIKTCICDNGDAALGVDCSGDGNAMCSGCLGDYELTGTECILVVSQLVSLGCYEDDSNRDIVGIESWDIPKDTTEGAVATCVNYCKFLEYLYAGVQAGHECMCGNSYGKYRTKDGECTSPCNDQVYVPESEELKYCGGEWRNQVYNTGYRASQPVAGPPRVFACDERAGSEYNAALRVLHPSTCSFSPVTHLISLGPSGLPSFYSFSNPIDSSMMKVWYFKSEDQMMFPGAKTFCEDRGLTMAQLHSDEEVNAFKILQGTGRSNRAFVGATHPGKLANTFTSFTKTGSSKYTEWKYLNGQTMCADKWWAGYNANDQTHGEPGNDPNEFYGGMEPPSADHTPGLHDFEATNKQLAMCEYRCVV